MSAPMLKSPIGANLAGALQALQITGQYNNPAAVANMFGGALGGKGTNAMGIGSSDVGQQILAELQVLNALQSIHNKKLVDSMDNVGNRPIKNNYFDIEKTQKDVARLNTEYGL